MQTPIAPGQCCTSLLKMTRLLNQHLKFSQKISDKCFVYYERLTKRDVRKISARQFFPEIIFPLHLASRELILFLVYSYSKNCKLQLNKKYNNSCNNYVPLSTKIKIKLTMLIHTFHKLLKRWKIQTFCFLIISLISVSCAKVQLCFRTEAQLNTILLLQKVYLNPPTWEQWYTAS